MEEIKKYKPFLIKTIIVSLSLSIIVGAGSYVFLSKKQTYKASTNIKFVNSAASNGYTYNGSKIEDVLEELTGSEVIDAAINDEGLKGEVTSNSVSEMLSIEGVIPKDEQDKIDSALDNGKEYEYNPVEYTISIDSEMPQAGKLLNSIVRNFITYYTKNYVNPDSFPSNVSTLISEDTSYDYIEQADLIKTNIETIELFLNEKASLDGDYHNSKTGYSFSDLVNKYEYIYNTKLPELYAKVLANKATKNPDLLLKKLEQNNSVYSTSSTDTYEELEKLYSMIKSYSEKNTSNGTVTNGQFGDDYDENHTSIIDGVYENATNPQSSYDSLFSTLISELDLISANSTSISYNDYLIEVFKDSSTISDKKLETEIEDLINETLSELNTLYEYANTARLEHLDIESTDMIVQVNTPIAVRQLSVKMYTLLAMIAVFLLTVVALPVLKIFIKNLLTFLDKKKQEQKMCQMAHKSEVDKGDFNGKRED